MGIRRHYLPPREKWRKTVTDHIGRVTDASSSLAVIMLNEKKKKFKIEDLRVDHWTCTTTGKLRKRALTNEISMIEYPFNEEVNYYEVHFVKQAFVKHVSADLAEALSLKSQGFW